MGGQQDGRRRGLVELPALDAEQPILDHVAAADAVLAAEPIQLAHQRQQVQRPRR